MADDGAVTAHRRVATPKGAYDATVDAVAQIIAQIIAAIEAETGAGASIGIGIPGVGSRATGRVTNAKA